MSTLDPYPAPHDEEATGSAAVTTPRPLRSAVHELEENAAVDQLSAKVAPVAARAGRGTMGEVLRGRWLGHALHPLLTDLPLGCWTAAGLLDVVGGRQSRPAARRLIGLGLLAVPVTVATGLAEWEDIEDEGTRRVATAHGLGNGLVGVLYLMSWRHRRAGRHKLGVVTALLGGAVAMWTGYLGGHLSFARGAGVGDRGVDEPVGPSEPDVAAEATVTTSTDGDGRVPGSPTNAATL